MAVMAGTPAVFLDKDGTLIENEPYNVDPARIRLAPGAGEALRRLQDAGYRLIVVSNQSGVARGYFEEAALATVVRQIRRLLASSGVWLTGFHYCPHHPEGAISEYAVACDCRKPMPGLVLQAAGAHRVDLRHSWLVGDILDDVEAGRRAGCRTVLLNRGNETEWRPGPDREPHCIVRSLSEAANVILSERDPLAPSIAERPAR